MLFLKHVIRVYGTAAAVAEPKIMIGLEHDCHSWLHFKNGPVLSLLDDYRGGVLRHGQMSLVAYADTSDHHEGSVLR